MAGLKLSEWTLVGPFFAPAGRGNWFPTALDGAAGAPADFRLEGKPVPVRKVRIRGNELDFEAWLGPLADRSRAGIRNQAYAFAEFEVPADLTAELVYDADRYAAWWLDGREVYATRESNGGPVGSMKHRFEIGLSRGRHCLAVRVISSVGRWRVLFRAARLRPGLADHLRADRGAAWRDYTRSLVRLEERPVPDGTCGPGISKENYELCFAAAGVDGRWISTVLDFEGSFFRSEHISAWPEQKPEHETQLKEWVDFLHSLRRPVMSWYPLSLSRPTGRDHPDWRQQFMLLDPAKVPYADAVCCINSPYGEAVIAYVIEALKKFDLDGIWFDGAAFSPIWQSPQPVSCVCGHCRRKFRAETGLELPERYDWSRPEFRRWVAWRYRMFGEYWQRLAERVHREVPEAAIVFNHYHRENIGWNAAVPLNPFGRDFVSGTEADGEPLKGAFHTRLMRAYGRAETEVWMGLSCTVRKAVRAGRQPLVNPKDTLDFVLACATAGGHPSLGGAEPAWELPVLAAVAAELKPRQPYLDLPAVPYLALHVSQQTETFVFGRNPDFITEDWVDYYWNSLTGWHHLVAHGGLGCDVLFDDHLADPERLDKYPVLVMPLAAALTGGQYRAALDYAAAGGTLVTGPWFGLFDEWGEAAAGRKTDERLFPFGSEFPAWPDLAGRPELSFGGPDRRRFKARPLAQLPAGSGRRVSLDFRPGNPAWRRTRVGRGQVVQLAVDLGTLFRYSGAEAVVRGWQGLLENLKVKRPLVENLSGDGLLLGTFRGKPGETVVHVQQFTPPWRPDDINVRAPGLRSNVRLRWNGPRPLSVRGAVPEPGPELKVRRQGGAWLIELPPFTWGQVVLIKTGPYRTKPKPTAARRSA